MNCQERVAYFMRKYEMEEDDALCLTNAIKYSEPIDPNQSQTTAPVYYQISPELHYSFLVLVQSIENLTKTTFELSKSVKNLQKSSLSDHNLNMTPSALLMNSLVEINLSDIPLFNETTGDSILTPENSGN